MNILFLTLAPVHSISERGIYTDLLRKFRELGHNVTVLTPVERRMGIETNMQELDGVSLLQVKTLNITKTNIIEKGIGTLAIEYQYLAAIKKYLSDVKFDLVYYSTPPITFAKVIAYIKKRDGAFAYLLLKDIFPQNAVDMKMMKEGSLLHRFFQHKERRLYQLSDRIGCMSPANVDFLLKNNPTLEPSKVEVNPNTISPLHIAYSVTEKESIRLKYNLPLDKKILVYGGNLGVPQGVEFLMETINQLKATDAYVLVVGNGTKYNKLKNWFETHKPSNACLLAGLSKADYDALLAACDVGLIFLHKDFTIPNFPSRLLTYLEMKKPVLAATDKNSDMGKIAEENKFGFYCESNSIHNFNKKLNYCIQNKEELQKMGENGYQF